MRIAAVLILMSSIGLANLSISTAQDFDWKAQLDGLQGVVITCLRTLERKYTARLCKKVTSHAAKRLKKAGIAHTVAPIIYSKESFVERVRHFDQQLDLSVMVRATKPGPLAIDLRVELSIPFTAASESGGPPRKGNLVFWDDGWTGAGSRKKLERAIGKAMLKELEPVLVALETHFPKSSPKN